MASVKISITSKPFHEYITHKKEFQWSFIPSNEMITGDFFWGKYSSQYTFQWFWRLQVITRIVKHIKSCHLYAWNWRQILKVRVWVCVCVCVCLNTYFLFRSTSFSPSFYISPYPISSSLALICFSFLSLFSMSLFSPVCLCLFPLKCHCWGSLELQTAFVAIYFTHGFMYC